MNYTESAVTATLLVDMTTLRLRRTRDARTVTAWTAHQELIARITVPERTSATSAAFQAMDGALATAVVTRYTGTARHEATLALYNPFTASIAHGSVRGGQGIYQADAPLIVPAGGLLLPPLEDRPSVFTVAGTDCVLDEDIATRGAALAYDLAS